MKWFVKALRQYADFRGRARRMEFFMFHVFYALIGVAIMLLEFAINGVFAGAEPQFILFTPLYGVAMLVPSLAVSVRRLHDGGRSGVWYFINLVPTVGGIIFLVFMFADSKPGDNQWGPNPKAPEA